MKYCNISGADLLIGQSKPEGVRSLRVAAGAEFATSPVHAKALLDSKSIKQVDAKQIGKIQKEAAK